MNIRVFNQLPTFEYMIGADLNVGDFFLTGSHIIQQKETKEVGHTVTYYEVISKDDNNIVSYTPRYDKLEG